jgi:hypothetical protein
VKEAIASTSAFWRRRVETRFDEDAVVVTRRLDDREYQRIMRLLQGMAQRRGKEARSEEQGEDVEIALNTQMRSVINQG